MVADVQRPGAWKSYLELAAGLGETSRKRVRKVVRDMVGKGNATADQLKAITSEVLDHTADRLGVVVRRGDYLLVRTGHVERCLAAQSWDGYSGGDAPGLAFETLDWLQEKQVAAIVTDTWGVEVRPNETEDTNQPWHWIAIPIMGLTVGEIFHLGDLARDCAEDERYEFMFVAPALPITGAVGSPANPLAIK